jgi:hypothetical protein
VPKVSAIPTSVSYILVISEQDFPTVLHQSASKPGIVTPSATSSVKGPSASSTHVRRNICSLNTCLDLFHSGVGVTKCLKEQLGVGFRSRFYEIKCIGMFNVVG